MREKKQNRKRKVEIDLTGHSDFDDQPTSKTQKGTSQSQTQRNGNNAPYPTPPVSSVAKSSQSSPQNRSGSQSLYGYSAADQQHSQAERNAWLAEDDDEDDYDQLFSSTQSAAANTDQLHHYGDLPTKVVGCRYYNGWVNPVVEGAIVIIVNAGYSYASPGEQILTRREPGNPYDKNAIRIDNVATSQIGHIPRRIAEKVRSAQQDPAVDHAARTHADQIGQLAKFMDNSYLHVEGNHKPTMAPILHI